MLIVFLLFSISFARKNPAGETESECPENVDQFTPITSADIPTSTNIYACKIDFHERAAINDGILHIYYCQFTHIKDSSVGALEVFVSDFCESDKTIIINNCYFFKCENVALKIGAMSKQASALITECVFEQCMYPSNSDEKGAIYLSYGYRSTLTVTIEKCQFLNNFATILDAIQDISVITDSSSFDPKLTIKSCVFNKKFTNGHKSSYLISITNKLQLTFEANEISIDESLNDIKLFEWPSDIDSTMYTFKSNIIRPYEKVYIDNIQNLNDDAFIEEEIDCQIPSNGYVIKCDNVFSDTEDDVSVSSNTFIGIYHCTFYHLYNANTGNGGAVYISTSYHENNIKEPICIHNSDFHDCASTNGGAIYIDSSDYTQLFDIYECVFHFNLYDFGYFVPKKGGAIYIRSSLASFKLSKCTFDQNSADDDGGAIYFISEQFGSSPQEGGAKSEYDFDLNIVDCKFTSNSANSNGGALYILIKNGDQSKPIDVNNCVFVSNRAVHKDSLAKAEESPEYGGAIFYSYGTPLTSISMALLEGENERNYILRLIDCTFDENHVNYDGGAIYLSITEGQPSKQIEINHCHFNNNIANNDEEEAATKYGSGSDIYYLFNSQSTRELISNNPSLLIYQCNFFGGQAKVDGGSIMISIQKGEPVRSIEINNCSFKKCTSEFGGAICYRYSSSSSSSNSRSILEDATDFALHVYDSLFEENEIKSEGGAIYMSILKDGPSKNIEINKCDFIRNKGIDADENEEHGGAIYYSFASESLFPSSTLNILYCNFNANTITYHGAAIYLSVSNNDTPKPIQIDHCSFSENEASTNYEFTGAKKGSGGDIYYVYDVQLCSMYPLLAITNSNFSEGTAIEEGGSINIYIKNADSYIGVIEISECTFDSTKSGPNNGGAIRYVSDAPPQSSTSSKKLLDDEPINKNNFALYINQCHFKGIKSLEYGGCISLSLLKGEPPKTVYISYCSFDGSYSKNGGSIHLSCDYPLAENENSSPILNVNNCNFTNNVDVEKGSSIFISVTNGEPTKTIQIDGCEFESNSANDGGSIYFDFRSTAGTTDIDGGTYALYVNKCKFKTNSAAANGAALYLSINNDEPSNPIEIAECEFTENEAKQTGSIYFGFQSKPSNSQSLRSLHVYKCTFTGDYSTEKGNAIYLSIQNDGPTKSIIIDECHFIGNKARNGGAICYNYLSSSSEVSPSKTLLEGSTDYALRVINCEFTGNEGLDNGGALSLFILDGEPTKPIEIDTCTFSENKAVEKEEGEQAPEYGGAIHYSFQSPKNTLLSNKQLKETSNYAFRLYNSTFSSNEASSYGGSVYMLLTNDRPTKPIEINGCSFISSFTSDIYPGYDICFVYETPSSSPSSLLESATALQLSDCKFTCVGTSDFDGFLYLVMNNINSKICEINKCSFDCSGSSGTSLNIRDASEIISNSESVHFHFFDCDFIGQGVSFNAYSAHFEGCRFTEIKITKNAFYYHVNDAKTPTQSLKFNNCMFKQNKKVGVLIHFENDLSSKFVFLNNTITIDAKNDVTRVFGCKEGMNVNENDWEIKENFIFPEDGVYLLAKGAEKIPAYCGIPFFCEVPISPSSPSMEEEEESSSVSSEEVEEKSSNSPTVEDSSSLTEEVSTSFELPPGMNCNLELENTRCDINGSIYEDKSSIDIISAKFHDLGDIGNDYGAAIHLYNFGLNCQDTSFEKCQAIGGGAIWIYLDKELPETSQVLLNNIHVDGCKAVYGGGVYIYSSVETEVQINASTFKQNEANRKPQNDGDYLYGGGAVFFQVLKGNILSCSFYRNKGSGVKIYNDFEQLQQNGKMLSKEFFTLIHPISIVNCYFEVDKKSSSSIFYVRGKNLDIPVDVNDCIFDGELDENVHHIDGISLAKKEENSKFRIRSCKFSSGNEKAVNLKKSAVLFDSFDNEYHQNIKREKEKEISTRRSADFNSIATVVSIISCISILIAFAIIMKSKNSKEENIDEVEDIFEMNKNEL